MTKRRLLDTNVIVRHLVQDNVSQAKQAGKLFAACDRGEIILVILSAVLAEAVFVFESFYNHSCRDIAFALGRLVASPGIQLEDDSVHQRALIEYGKGKLHFVDCLIAAYAKENEWPVSTFDHELRKLPDIRIELD
jgi:predicted nucleic-acid-binding protein